MEWYLGVFKKFAVFEGRSRRQEYWMFVLFNFIAMFVLSVVDGMIFGTQLLSGLYSLAVLVPAIALSVRRLHDIGKSGLWMLLALIPFLGWLALFVFSVMDSEPGSNAYGPNPKGE